MESVLAIDIGGTKVDVGLVTFEGHIISRDRFLTLEASEGSLYKRILEVAHKEVTKADTTPRAIGVGCGGQAKMHTISSRHSTLRNGEISAAPKH